METLTSLLIIFLFLFAGMAGARFKLIPETGYLDRIMSTALALLLFSMGLRIGMLESITQQLMRIGLLSLSFAVATVLGTLVLLLALMALTGKLGGAAGSQPARPAGPGKPDGIAEPAEPAVGSRSTEPPAEQAGMGVMEGAEPWVSGLGEPFRLFL